MNNDELKTALLNHTPVILKAPLLGEIKYERITAIIYREEKGRIVVSAELLDKNKNSVTIASPKTIRFLEVKG